MKRVHALSLAVFSVFVVLAFLFASCQGREQAKQPAPQTETTTAQPSSGATCKGTVTFLCGSATMTSGSSSIPVDIGAEVSVDASITTDKDSVCEIQFADFGSIHLSEGSTLVVKKFFTDATHTESEMQLNAGKVVCKVRKLSGDDSFRVRTPEMVCGVRGTVFQISREANKPVKIAVSEGAVAVYPPSVAAAESLAAPVAEELHECAPVVAAGQEASVTTETMKALDQTLSTLVAAAAANPEAAVTENVSEYKKIAASVITNVVPVSTEAREDFSDASNLVLGTAQVPQVAQPGTAVQPPAPAKIQVTVTVDPADAVTTINGTARFKGSFFGLYEDGTKLNLKVELEGYGSVEESVPVSGNGEIKKTIHLEKTAKTDPTSFFPVSAAKLVCVSAGADGTCFASDAKSTVFAIAADGKILWSAKTQNGSNGINPPVTNGSVVAFMGDKTLSVFDAASGKSLWSLNLDKTNTGLYGRHAALGKNRLYVTCDDGIAVYDLKTGAPVSTISFADGSDMSPALVNGKLHVVSKTGVWHQINSETFAIEKSVETGAVQPVASAPVVQGGTLVFADRKGTVTAIDIAKASVVWQSKLDESRSVDVFVDPVVTPNAVYVFAKGRLYALSLASGKVLFPAVENVNSQVCVSSGALWLGSSGNALLALPPSGGAAVKKIAVPASVSGIPVQAGSRLFVPLANGQLMATSGIVQ